MPQHIPQKLKKKKLLNKNFYEKIFEITKANKKYGFLKKYLISFYLPFDLKFVQVKKCKGEC